MTDPHRPRDPAEPETSGNALRTPERRKRTQAKDDAALLAGLTPEQLVTVQTMEAFHWHLRFVRRPLFKTPQPVLFNRDGEYYVVVNEDGTIDEHPMLTLRD